ncbi:MAG: amino acid transporter [Planctomycetaceae bacterium]|nr:amino acid transporter [Planctomycetaceae bacterium]
MATSTQPKTIPAGYAWWLVLCLIGLDYFSTLAYVPSLAVQAVGPLAPFAAIVIAAITVVAALPVYLYVVGRSPHGRGATGLLERSIPGWTGKLLILLLLAFVATDYVVTQNLSVADAAEHVRGNPLFRVHVDPLLDARWHPERWSDNPLWQRVVQVFDRQLVMTLLLSMVSFASWTLWWRGSPQLFLRIAAVVVIAYLLFNLIVLASAVLHLSGAGRAMFNEWRESALLELNDASGIRGAWSAWKLACLAFVSFPYVALGLSGFELSMAVTPLVRGAVDDDKDQPRGRIRNMRKLLIVAAGLMAVGLCLAVSVTAMLVPVDALAEGGPAVHRTLAYLAHGGRLADGQSASAMNGAFGPAFGTMYDAATISILCLAGACVAIALRDYVPQSLQRFGMELDWARRLGVKMRFFNVVVLVVVVLFHAHIDALQWVYATSVLVLLSGASLAAVIDVRRRLARTWPRRLAVAPFAVILVFFAGMTLLTILISRAGLEIALAFAVGLFATSLVSRWIRSTELRFQGFEFVDDDSRIAWQHCCAHEFQVLVPHRPGLRPRAEKNRAIRLRHRLGADVPIILVEAQLGDTSDFLQAPLMRITREEGVDLIEVSRCVSVSHVLAAMALEMSRVGRPPELHFGWSDESPLAANLNFLLFGEGNIPWMVRELTRHAEPDSDRRPKIIIG